MSTQEFWPELERRIANEVAASGRTDLRGFWCDGLYLTRYLFDETPPRAEGTIFFGRTGQEVWHLQVALGTQPHATSLDDLDWDALLPARRRTGWLTVDIEARLVAVDPAVADESESDVIVQPNGVTTVVPRGGSPERPDDRRRPPGGRYQTYLRRVHGALDSENGEPTLSTSGELRRARRLGDFRRKRYRPPPYRD
jgi:hypothetical protein